jgi:hypothetical protein
MSRLNIQPSPQNGGTSLAQLTGQIGLNGQTTTLHSTSSTSSTQQKIMQRMEIKESRHMEVKSENRNYRLQ